MPRSHPRYAPEYRQRIIELARAGRSLSELARQFEPTVETIRLWVKQAELDEGLRSDGLKELDFSLNKNVAINDRTKLQLRADCFNLTNTPQFAPPAVALGNANFGTVSAQNNQPRVLQVAMKLIF